MSARFYGLVLLTLLGFARACIVTPAEAQVSAERDALALLRICEAP